jgi:20S proteasome subunit beta 3
MEYNGGAVIAMVGKDCVAIASDKRFGVQFQTIGFENEKVYRIQPRVMVGLTGLASDVQTMAQKLEFRAKLYNLREERDMEPKTLAHLLSQLLYEKRFGPYYTEPVVAGLDAHDKPYICGMDLLGAQELAKDFVVTGTCTENMFGMAESLWRPDLEPADLIEIVSQCLLASVDRDAYSGWGAVVHLLTKDGVLTKHLKTRMD